MPRFENSLSKFIYILVSIFFLITAPFNLGYFGSKLVGELIPDKKVQTVKIAQVAGESVKITYPSSDNGVYPDEVVITEAPIEPTEITEEVINEPNATSRSTIDYTNELNGPVSFFLCIDDSEGGADWTLFLNDPIEPDVYISAEDLERFNSGNLFIYCQKRVRIRDASQELLIERIKDGITLQQSLTMIGSDRYSYLILKYSEGSITYEITEERPG